MTAILSSWLPWLMSGLTILLTIAGGHKHRFTWLIGIVSQSVWAFWIVTSQQWGFIPQCAVLLVLYSYNHWKWMREAV